MMEENNDIFLAGDDTLVYLARPIKASILNLNSYK